MRLQTLSKNLKTIKNVVGALIIEKAVSLTKDLENFTFLWAFVQTCMKKISKNLNYKKVTPLRGLKMKYR